MSAETATLLWKLQYEKMLTSLKSNIQLRETAQAKYYYSLATYLFTKSAPANRIR